MLFPVFLSISSLLQREDTCSQVLKSTICNGCGMPTGDAYSSGHLVPSLWDLHMFYLLRPILFPNLSLLFRTMLFEYPSVHSRFCFVAFWDHQNCPCLKLIEIVILWVYYTIPFGFSLIRHFLAISFNFLSFFRLTKDHWWRFGTRNAHMIHTFN